LERFVEIGGSGRRYRAMKISARSYLDTQE